MTIADLIVIGILAVILIAAVGTIYRAKKNGKKCIGCPDGGSCGSCSSDCSCCGSCHHK